MPRKWPIFSLLIFVIISIGRPLAFAEEITLTTVTPGNQWVNSTSDPNDIYYTEGNVGIGTTNPTDILNVNGNITIRPGQFFRWEDADGTYRGAIRAHETLYDLEFYTQAAGGGARVTIQNGGDLIVNTGNVGIGTDSPGAKLELNNGAGAWSRANPGDSQFAVGSSKAIKENLKMVNGDGILIKILNVPVYTFDYKKGPKGKMGLISEDFHKIFKRGSNKELNGQEVEMALWLAVQELAKNAVKIEKENKDLKTQIERLEKRLSQVEKLCSVSQYDGSK